MQIHQDPKYDVAIMNGQGVIIDRISGQPIPDDEPIFILRAKDILAIPTLLQYQNNVLSLPPTEQNNVLVQSLVQRVRAFQNFQMNSKGRVRYPG